MKANASKEERSLKDFEKALRKGVKQVKAIKVPGLSPDRETAADLWFLAVELEEEYPAIAALLRQLQASPATKPSRAYNRPAINDDAPAIAS